LFALGVIPFRGRTSGRCVTVVPEPEGEGRTTSPQRRVPSWLATKDALPRWRRPPR